MTSANCNVIPPSGQTAVNDGKVYRCQGVAAAINDTDSDILYNVTIVITDSVGNSNVYNEANLVATAGGSSSTGPFYADLDAGLYSSGDVITFTGKMTLTAGLSTSNSQSNTLTVP